MTIFNMKKLIGFIGQGWIGKNYADDFENRGYSVVRYTRDPKYIANKDRLKECDIVFVAVPTPTRNEKFDDSVVRSVMKLVGKGKTAVIKSTILPGTTISIQKENPNIYVFHSPEFLTEATAAFNAAHPDRNIVGVPYGTEKEKRLAKEVLSVLPEAPYETVCSSYEAEFVKYGGNCWFYTKVIFVNLLYDLTKKMGCDWDIIKKAMAADPRIGSTHLNAIHSTTDERLKSLRFGDYHLDPIHKSGRGAGGHCFIKDFAAFSEMYEKEIGDERGMKVLQSLRDKNIELLLGSNKDLDLLQEVYGKSVLKKKKTPVSRKKAKK